MRGGPPRPLPQSPGSKGIQRARSQASSGAQNTAPPTRLRPSGREGGESAPASVVAPSFGPGDLILVGGSGPCCHIAQAPFVSGFCGQEPEGLLTCAPRGCQGAPRWHFGSIWEPFGAPFGILWAFFFNTFSVLIFIWSFRCIFLNLCSKMVPKRVQREGLRLHFSHQRPLLKRILEATSIFHRFLIDLSLIWD